MDYVRRAYRVPAKRGGRVTYTGSSDGCPRRGTILSADSALWIRLDGDKHRARFHPTFELTYDDAAPEPAPSAEEAPVA